MEASHFNPRDSGPNAEPTVSLNTFVPNENGPITAISSFEAGKTFTEVGEYPIDAYTTDFSSDAVANSIYKKSSTLSARTPNFLFSSGRLAIFNSLSPLVKNIFIILYGSKENFVSATGHPLEEPLITFDRNLDSSTAVRAIGSAIGIYVDVDANFFAWELFMDKIISCIVQLEIKRINDVKYANRPKMQDIIRMTRKEFKRYREKDDTDYAEMFRQRTRLDKEAFEENLYQDRMNYFRFMSLTDEEKYEEINGLPSAYDTVPKPGAESLNSQLVKEKYYDVGI